MPSRKQAAVVVRIDVILYAVVAVVAILALASLVTGRVDVGLVGALLTFATGALTGWLTYLRLCNGKGRGDDDAEPDGTDSR